MVSDMRAQLIPVLLGLMSFLGCEARGPSAARPGPTIRALYQLPVVTSLTAAHTALLLVDFQREFFDGRLPLPDGAAAADNARRLLGWARANGIAVVFVRNLTRPGAPAFAPDAPTSAFAPGLEPREGELVTTKPTGGAFTKTDLDERLRARGVDTLLVAGLMAHLAVLVTAEQGSVLGYRVVAAADATAARDLPATNGSPAVGHEALAAASLATIADRYGDVRTTDDVLRLPLAAPQG